MLGLGNGQHLLNLCLFSVALGRKGVPPSTKYPHNPHTALPPSTTDLLPYDLFPSLHFLEKMGISSAGQEKATGRQERTGPPAGQLVPMQSPSQGWPLPSLIISLPEGAAPRTPASAEPPGKYGNCTWKGLIPTALRRSFWLRTVFPEFRAVLHVLPSLPARLAASPPSSSPPLPWVVPSGPLTSHRSPSPAWETAHHWNLTTGAFASAPVQAWSLLISVCGHSGIYALPPACVGQAPLEMRLPSPSLPLNPAQEHRAGSGREEGPGRQRTFPGGSRMY